MQERKNVEEVTSIYDRVNASVGAETLLAAMGPGLERRIQTLLAKLAIAPPELGALLDLRAQITECNRIWSELKRAASGKQSALDALQRVLGQSANQ